MSKKTVTMIFPTRVRLTRDDNRVIDFEPGPQEVPVELKDHFYLRDHGVKEYVPSEPKIEEPPPALAKPVDEEPAEAEETEPEEAEEEEAPEEAKPRRRRRG